MCRASYHARDQAPLLVVLLAKACHIRLYYVEQLGHNLQQQQQHAPDEPMLANASKCLAWSSKTLAMTGTLHGNVLHIMQGSCLANSCRLQACPTHTGKLVR
jgi:hypothetical protein